MIVSFHPAPAAALATVGGPAGLLPAACHPCVERQPARSTPAGKFFPKILRHRNQAAGDLL
jgi:hypothetical protein